MKPTTSKGTVECMASMGESELLCAVAVVCTGASYSRIERLSKGNARYAGICDTDGRIHRFSATAVVEIRPLELADLMRFVARNPMLNTVLPPLV